MLVNFWMELAFGFVRQAPTSPLEEHLLEGAEML